MTKPTVDLETVLRLYAELRDRIHDQNSGSFEVEESRFGIVGLKLFGFSFNTYKSIWFLLQEHFYEQAAALYRTLWESGANLEWISRDPEPRAHRFLTFTLVEHRRFLHRRIEAARRAGDHEAVTLLSKRLGEFERAVARELAQFRTADRRGRPKWSARFSGGSLEDVVREIGGEWIEEYDRDYLLGSTYTHGAPGGTLFPLYDGPGAQVAKCWDIERSGITGAMAVHVMIRINRLWLKVRGREDEEYMRCLAYRVREAGSV